MSGETCPDIIELDDGNFLVIGKLAPPDIDLPRDVLVGSGEEAVVIPRRVLLDARKDIPDE